MIAIWKFPFKIDDCVTIEMPTGAHLLSVQMQHATPCIWALVDTKPITTEVRRFRVIGTGHPIDDDLETLKFVGTFQMHGGALVFHLFAVTP